MRRGVIYKVSIGNNFIIGSSLTPKKRKNEYVRDLNKGVWNNPYLQNSYNKYNNFKWEILQNDVPENILEHVEDIWIGALCGKIYDKKGGMNIRDAYRSKLSDYGKIKIAELNSIKIYEYDLEGNFIKEWKSGAEASRSKGIYRNAIWQNLNGITRKAGDSIWSYIESSRVNGYINTIGKTNTRKVNQYSLSGELIREWESAMEIFRQLNINNTCIGNVCLGKQASTGGFKWEYI